MTLGRGRRRSREKVEPVDESGKVPRVRLNSEEGGFDVKTGSERICFRMC